MKSSSFLPLWIAAILVSSGIESAYGQSGAQRPLGIDVSSYQGSADSPPTNINWPAVQAAGISFAWAKATEGTGYFDADFTYNMKQAKAAGVLIGAYHYCHPELHIGTNGADLEAAYFWNHVQAYITNGGTYLMPMLDFEQDVTNASPPYTKATLSAWVNEWCQDIVNYAASNGVTVTPIVYTYTSYSAGTSGNGPGVNNTVTNWPLWMAQYPSHPNPQTGAPSSTAPWSTWAIWQYSSTSTINGIENETDEDVFNGSAATLANFVIGGEAPSITAQPTNVTLIQGGTADLSVTAIPGLLSYQWQFDNTNIAGATNSQLIFSNVQPSASGNYLVIVTNVVGTLYSSNALLTVEPMITNVAVVPRLDSAIITWTSATNATGQVMYSTDMSYGSMAPSSATNATQHSVLLQGLQTGTTYNFQLLSTNAPYGGTYTGSFSTDGRLIVESSQANYTGVWTVDSAAPDKYGEYYEFADTTAGNDTATAFFRPNIAAAGLYDVYFWYSEGTNRSQFAPVIVGYQGGDAELVFNEQTNGGSWQLLASAAPFAAGTNGYVRLGNGTGETNKVVIADTVMFVYTADQDLPTNNTPPAWWMNYYYGTNSTSASSDTDGDGYSAYAEYVVGTDPTKGSSHLQVTAQPAAGGGVQVIFSPYYYNSGRQYQLQSSTSLTNGTWANLPLTAVTTNTNGQGVLTITNLSGGQNYLRLSVSMTQQ